MSISKAGVFVILLLCLSITVAYAQEDTCPAIVQTALAAADDACTGIGRNQACYGNINLSAVPQAGAPKFSFSQPGDLVNVADVQTLTLSPLDRESDVWGVALMKIQANLPDTLPGQNVTFLLFGDVEIANAVTTNVEAVTLEGTAGAMTPLMESFTETTTMPTMLSDGDLLTIDGRDSTGQFLHVIIEDGTVGWVPEMMVQVEGDTNILPVIDLLSGESASASAPTLNPMQAFYFKTGANDAPCEEAPDSGILIQTPEGAGQVELTMNGVDIQLGSTTYVQAGEELTFNLIEGSSVVTAEGVSRTLQEGTRVRVPLEEQDGNLVAAAEPSEVEPYDASELAALPLGLLERDITIAAPLTAEELAALGSVELYEGDPVAGRWRYTAVDSITSEGCPPQLASALSNVSGYTTETEFELPGGKLNLEELFQVSEMGLEGTPVFSEPQPGVYVMEITMEEGTFHWEVRVVSPTRMEGMYSLSMVDICTFSLSFTVEAVG
ncbi:MAG: hypothetical protein K8L97_19975 [Anaerolineae bacterium]|nr:hypothetical protein [Anaerolineae bacterium]